MLIGMGPHRICVGLLFFLCLFNFLSAVSTTCFIIFSFYIQMQLCNPSTLADWIKHRNGSSSLEFDAGERQARARSALGIFRQIVDGLAHVQ